MVYLIKWQGSVHIEYKYISLHLKATKLLGFLSKRLHTSSVTSRTSLRLQIEQQSRQEPIVGHDSVHRPYVDK